MIDIRDWGWNDRFQALAGALDIPGAVPGRIVLESRNIYRAVAEAGEVLSRVSGSLRNRLTDPSGFPAVGDWVLLEPSGGDSQWPIVEVLPRSSAFSRKSAGEVTEEQIIAANVDFVFLVSAIDGTRNFNERGLERYIAMAWESGSMPVVVLNKADLCGERNEVLARAASAAPGVPVHAVSCIDGTGFDELAPYLLPGRTIALTGRSGVGKSSIVNRLAGRDLLDTGPARENDARGRHTTTRRELVRLESGVLLIDTPGLRELQLWGSEASLGGAFPEIEELASGCRFNDCSHSHEPGCAVHAALADGSLDQARYESYLDLKRELRHLSTKQDIKARLAERERWKAVSKFSKELNRNRRG